MILSTISEAGMGAQAASGDSWKPPQTLGGVHQMDG
tara:strand:- start:1698 stop:1805 length:108 start_codon:yes stop_codon:yes gene_type:complete